MRRLVAVELTRLRWRRAVLLLVAAAVVVPAVIWGSTAWSTRPLSDSEQAQVDQNMAQPYAQRELRRCERRPANYGLASSADPAAACRAEMTRWNGPRAPLDLDQERTGGSGVAVVTVLAVLLLLIGTTFVGHDWNSGSMSNQLLFEPRRGRVWVAKGVVALLCGAVLAGLVLSAYWTGLWMLAESRGLNPTDASVSEAYQQALRGTAFVACAGLGGYALTMLFRSTVATLGVLLAVSLVVPVLLAIIAFPGSERWMPQNNIAAVVLDGMTYYEESAVTCDADGMCSGEQRLTLEDGSAYLLGLLLVAAIPSVASFRRRDVP
jgi:ABC-2 type transport system permease protein